MFDWFTDSRFGIVTTRLILFVAIGLALLPFQPSELAVNPQDVTFLSRVPESVLSDVFVIYAVQAIVVLSSVLWLVGWLVPLSCWTAVLSFAVLAALRIQYSAELCHSYHFLWMLMLVHAAWYTYCKREVTEQEFRDRKNHDYPAWVLWLSVFVIAWFHTLSGVGKWATAADWTAGWNWADGVSLQLWLSSFGNPSSRLVRWIIEDHGVALVVQRAILVIELSAILAIFNATLRRIVGVTLLGYYAFFLHCFVDWTNVLAQVGLNSASVNVPAGADFPAMSYMFQAFWVAWIFLVSDRMLGTWTRSEPS